ncbi:MAG: peptidase T [Clostridia bacterium]|nr:peptidase T [Clostridia bacterium]
MKAYERFLEYAVIPTMSDDTSESVPSTAKQLVLASKLKDELLALGLEDARVDEYGYVYASMPANTDIPTDTIGFIAHMDTAHDAPDENISPVITEYSGGDIVLNEELGIVLRADDYPYIEDYAGHHIITSDGTTLLGADDKAGIAEIMTAIEKIIDTGAAHGKICVAFTPDEEIGRGADHFDVSGFGASYAYTVDGGAIGEIEYENFNAASAKVTVNGISIHPGSAKDRMKNASLIAFEFNSLLPQDEIPEKTSGYEGFHHLLSMSGECEIAKLSYIIRDHDMEKFKSKKHDFVAAAETINKKYGEGTVTLTITDSYYNMKEKIEPCMYIVDRAKQAMLSVGITPVTVPIRGGTDGAQLSFKGLPCPNLCTGGENFHSRFEFVSVEVMEKISDIIAEIIKGAVGA